MLDTHRQEESTRCLRMRKHVYMPMMLAPLGTADMTMTAAT